MDERGVDARVARHVGDPRPVLRVVPATEVRIVAGRASQAGEVLTLATLRNRLDAQAAFAAHGGQVQLAARRRGSPVVDVRLPSRAPGA